MSQHGQHETAVFDFKGDTVTIEKPNAEFAKEHGVWCILTVDSFGGKTVIEMNEDELESFICCLEEG